MSLVPPGRTTLRIAVSFSGGVSLAVWMGGVATEIERLTRGKHDVYRQICDLLGRTVEVDVLAGTSAGGINGAALALSLASGSDLDALRATWARHGSFDELLRPVTQADPPSVLRGDHLLDKLLETFATLARPETLDPVAWKDDLRLTLTTTLFTPEVRTRRDAFGDELAVTRHLGLVRFAGPWLIEDHARLAAVARASASHPGGFEPARLLVNPDGSGAGRELGRRADWRFDTWALDGGLLLNEPLAPILEDVYRRPAREAVRRVLLHVTPWVGGRKQPTPGPRPPDIRAMAFAAIDVPRQRDLADELGTMAERNLEVMLRRQRWHRWLEEDATVAPTEVEEASDVLSHVAAARLLAEAPRLRELAHDQPLAGRGSPVIRWVCETRAVALDETMTLHADAGERRLWTYETARTSVNAAIDIMRARLRDQPGDDTIADAKQELHAIQQRIEAAAWTELAAWDDGLADALAADQLPDPAETGRHLARSWWSGDRNPYEMAVTEIVDVVELVGIERFHSIAIRDVLAYRGGFVDQDADLVALSANAWMGFPPRGAPTTVGAGAVLDADDKLTGMGLAHFAAFYKRSWRLNDWMWGRLDAAYHLCRVVLEPSAFAMCATGDPETDAVVVTELVGKLEAIATGGTNDERATLSADAHIWRPLVTSEIRRAVAGEEISFEHTVRWVCRRLQLDILRGELPHIADGYRFDKEQAAFAGNPPLMPVPAPPPGAQLTPAQAVDAMAGYRVHTERLGDEKDTWQYRALASQAAGVTVNAVAGKRSGLRHIRLLVGALRGVTSLAAMVAQALRDRVRLRKHPPQP